MRTESCSGDSFLEHLPTPFAFVTPSLPLIAVLSTPCGNLKRHLFTLKSSTGIVPVCPVFGMKSKRVLSFKKKKVAFFFSFSFLFHSSSCFSPCFAAHSPGSWLPPGGATVHYPQTERLALLHTTHERDC